MRTQTPTAALTALVLLAACGTQNQTPEPPATTPKTHTLGMGLPLEPYTWTNDVTGITQTVRVTRVGDKIVYQGEVLGNWTGSDGLKPQAAIVTSRKWPNNTIPYTINASRNTRTEVQRAIAYYNTNTNLRWVERTNQADYVEFVNVNDGCWSYVGRIGGKQQIGLDTDGCGYATALHEMGHALGFHHEQSRPDRNQYVRVRLDLIPDDIESNWDIESESRGYGAYDYYSIMHYDLFYNGRKVIEVLQPGIDEARIGNGQSLSATDISAVNSLYPNGTTPPATQTYTGSLSRTGALGYHSSQSGFRVTAGTLKGTLTGPSGTDFDLFLQKQSGSTWTTVADSQSESSSETINYTAGAGTYRWQVYSYSGKGSYTLVTQ